MEPLNNREIATLIWLVVLGAWGLSKAAIRKSVLGVFQAVLKWKILLPILLQITYVALVVCGLSYVGIWDVSQLRNTILWTVLVGIASIFRIDTSAGDPKLLRTWVADNLKILVLIEFIVAFYTFHIAVELVMLPILALLGAMLALSKHRTEYQHLAKFLDRLFSILGLALVMYALYRLSDEFQQLASMQTLRDFSIPPILSFLLIPFLFVLYVLISYENAFLRLRFAVRNGDLRSFAKFQAILAFRHNVELLRRWARNIGVWRPSDRNAVRRSIREVKEARKREKNPQPVPPTKGWSPYAAITFLREEGLVTDDYHRLFDEWSASCPRYEVGNGVLKDTIAYYVEGDEDAATRLRLVLNVTNPTQPTASDEHFRKLALVLFKKALNTENVTEGLDGILCRDHACLHLGDTDIRLSREEWNVGITGSYERRFVIEHRGSAQRSESKT